MPAEAAPFAADPVIGLRVFCADEGETMRRNSTSETQEVAVFIIFDSSRASEFVLCAGSRTATQFPAIMF
jgi:hypothetical protein